MNRIYKLWVDDCDWDQYDGFVIIAHDIRKAKEMVLKSPDAKSGFMGNWNETNMHYKEVGFSHLEEQFVLESFNAG